MTVKRKTFEFQNREIIEIEEDIDGRSKCIGIKRAKKKKPTKEQVALVNARNKSKRCRHRLLTYFTPGDIFATLTYKVENRPLDMEAALKDFDNFRRAMKKLYKKENKEMFWIRNIERGTKGAWHIHLVINEIGNTATYLINCWKKGLVNIQRIKESKFNEKDMAALADYMTKDENTREKKKDGTLAKPRLRETSFNISRNMPLPEPKVDKLVKWNTQPKAKKDYYIAREHTGVNPITGLPYRRMTMIKLKGEENVFKKRYFEEAYENSLQGQNDGFDYLT